MNSHVLSLRARRAATVIDDEALDRLDELNQRMGEAIKSEATSDLSSINRQYHREINLAVQSPRLRAFVRLAEISIPDLTFEPHPAPPGCRQQRGGKKPRPIHYNDHRPHQGRQQRAPGYDPDIVIDLSAVIVRRSLLACYINEYHRAA